MIFATTKERILEFIDFKGLKVKEFLEITSIKRGFLDSDKLNSSVSDVFLANIIAKFTDLNPIWLITGKGEMILQNPVQVFNKINDGVIPDMQNVPFYDLEAAAGIVSLFNDQHNNAVDHIHVPGIPKCDGAIKVSGDSMYPLLKSGDIVMYKKVQDPVNAIYFYGEMYIVSIDQDGDDFVVVKYIHRSDKGDGWIKLVSQNPNHDAIDVPTSSIRALALVKASIRINSMQ
jgi:phage repressor protein C with HTH and peptisase S24 domain